MEIKKKFSNFSDAVVDKLEKTSSASTRAGATVERTGKMVRAGVPDAVIALQLTANSARGYTYEADEISTIKKLAGDSKTRVGVTAKQARALIRDQEDVRMEQVKAIRKKEVQPIDERKNTDVS